MILRFLVLAVLVFLSGCGTRQPDTSSKKESSSKDMPIMDLTHRYGKKALLLTRFKSFEQLKEVVDIRFIKAIPISNGPKHGRPQVQLTYRYGDRELTSELHYGVHEEDFVKARTGTVWDKLRIGLICPFTVIHRKALMCIEILGRRRYGWFGEGDISFYDIAQHMTYNIAAEDLPNIPTEDLTEKGYLNTFNHVMAQAFMTTLYSESIADFVSDVHERQTMPELITGDFTEAQINDLVKGPVDNYVDMINNEWGQELGKELKEKYSIDKHTHWTPELLANYLNDIQSYHSYAFQIGFKPFKPGDNMILRFTEKLNSVLTDVVQLSSRYR